MISPITNGEAGSSVRTKLNQLISGDNASNIKYITVNAGENLSAKDVAYLDVGGTLFKADASAEATAGPVLIGWVSGAASSGNPCTLIYDGEVADTGLSVGPYYVSTTAGAKTTTAPSTTGEIVRILGYAISSSGFIVSPDKTYVLIGSGIDIMPVNYQSGTLYTGVLADANGTVEMDNAATNSYYIPKDIFPVGTTKNIVQVGAGTTRCIGVSGVTLNDALDTGDGGSVVSGQGQWKGMSLYQDSLNSWRVMGGA